MLGNHWERYSDLSKRALRRGALFIFNSELLYLYLFRRSSPPIKLSLDSGRHSLLSVLEGMNHSCSLRRSDFLSSTRPLSGDKVRHNNRKSWNTLYRFSKKKTIRKQFLDYLNINLTISPSTDMLILQKSSTILFRMSLDIYSI